MIQLIKALFTLALKLDPVAFFKKVLFPIGIAISVVSLSLAAHYHPDYHALLLVWLVSGVFFWVPWFMALMWNFNFR